VTQHDPGVSGWQLFQELAKVSAKIDVLLSGQADHEARIRLLEKAPQGTDHEDRLRALEKGRWPLANIMPLLTLAGVLVAILVAVLKH
jgi:hypothetical protein